MFTSQFQNTHKVPLIYLLIPLLIAFLSVSWLLKKYVASLKIPYRYAVNPGKGVSDEPLSAKPA
jgi:hypothetical protein